MSEVALETAGLQKSFGALVVADNINLRLQKGARHALIGPNGAGKTSLVGLLSGVLRPDAGRITLKGQDITKLPAARRVKHGLVRTFQLNNLFRKFTVLENVYLAASEQRHASFDLWSAAGKRRDLLQHSERIIELLGLTSNMHHKVSELAYGHQRMVEIAIALSLEPKVLLLDEPTAGVPRAEMGRLLDLVERLPAEMAILLIEHDMQVVRRFASRVTVLVAGAILMSGSPRDVMASEEVQAVYLGQSGHERLAFG
jgi:branched-chain amino acid transport system ATP-binding protein